MFRYCRKRRKVPFLYNALKKGGKETEAQEMQITKKHNRKYISEISRIFILKRTFEQILSS